VVDFDVVTFVEVVVFCVVVVVAVVGTIGVVLIVHTTISFDVGCCPVSVSVFLHPVRLVISRADAITNVFVPLWEHRFLLILLEFLMVFVSFLFNV
jgi:hypothetical protein